jgi:lactate dehydrogenase-like 2-hydroxyacid dehydrogenase
MPVRLSPFVFCTLRLTTRPCPSTAGPDLKALATCSVGFEHIDQSAVKKAGLRVGYTPDVLTDAVADIAIMLLLMASRNAGSTIKLVQDGEVLAFADHHCVLPC